MTSNNEITPAAYHDRRSPSLVFDNLREEIDLFYGMLIRVLWVRFECRYIDHLIVCAMDLYTVRWPFPFRRRFHLCQIHGFRCLYSCQTGRYGRLSQHACSSPLGFKCSVNHQGPELIAHTSAAFSIRSLNARMLSPTRSNGR